MNWDAIGAIGETVGALAVVVSLIYVALQLRSQNKEARISAQQQIAEAFRSVISVGNDPRIADLVVKAMDETEKLTDSERFQLLSIHQSFLRVWEQAHYQYSEGRLEQSMWEGMLAAFSDLMSNDQVQHTWSIRKHTYRKEFAAFVDGIKLGNYKIK